MITPAHETHETDSPLPCFDLPCIDLPRCVCTSAEQVLDRLHSQLAVCSIHEVAAPASSTAGYRAQLGQWKPVKDPRTLPCVSTFV